jgi:DNA modification methylase
MSNATTADVLEGRARWSCVASDAVAFLNSLPDACVDMVFCSPPYTDARTYGAAADRGSAQWVEWMRPIIREACRVSKCLVFFNVSDRVEEHEYQNGPEWLHADLTRLDGLAAVRPYIWHKCHPDHEDAPNNGQPGSGAKHFHRNAYEPIFGYAERQKLPPKWSNQTAFGEPPRYKAGGKMTQRMKDGTRANSGRMTRLGAAGQPAITNPGNVIRAIVGGGHLGHPLAHESEAPMPLAVAERFVCWFCPPDGITLDPFTGSGTTAHAAFQHGRRFVGCDLRQSQVELCERRLATVTPDMFAEGAA